jgi:hypothetical protein
MDWMRTAAQRSSSMMTVVLFSLLTPFRFVMGVIVAQILLCAVLPFAAHLTGEEAMKRLWPWVAALALLPATPLLGQKAEMDALKKKVAGLEAQVKYLTTVTRRLDHKSATFELPRSVGNYSRVDSGSVDLLVLVEDVTPYLDGYKLTLQIGNPTSALLTNARLDVSWGNKLSPNSTDADFKKYLETFRQSEFPVNGDLKPGMWTRTEIILSPASRDSFGEVSIGINVPAVVLSAPK